MSAVAAKAPSKVPVKARPGSPPTGAARKVSVKGSASPPLGSKSPVGAKSPVGVKRAPVASSSAKAASPAVATSPKRVVSKVAAKIPVAAATTPRAASPPASSVVSSPPAKAAPAKKMISKKVLVAPAAQPPPQPAAVYEVSGVTTPLSTSQEEDYPSPASANVSFAQSVVDVQRSASMQSATSGISGHNTMQPLSNITPPNPYHQTVVIDSSLAKNEMSASEAISKNQQAAAALAALIGKQQEIDNEKIKSLQEKNEILITLLKEREGELKGTIAELERDVSKLQHASTSNKRENEVLKEILADRDGPKLVQKMEFLEEDAKRLKEDVGKWKEMADYHRDAHLNALDQIQRLKEGQPIGPTETDWNDAQEKVARLARENTTLAFKVASMEERLETTMGGGVGMAAPAYHHNGQQQTIEYGVSQSGEVAMGRGVSNSLVTTSSSPQQYESPYRHSHNGNLLRQQQQQPMGTNNSQFNSFSGSPVRGSPSSMSGPGGVKGWRALLLPNGNVVYHNMITNRSQWEIPEELARNLTERPI